MYHSPMESSLQIHLERDKQRSLTDQITTAIGAAIHEGRLAPGARLPSWRDLAAQLGVARGTVRVAYENLRDLQLVDTAGAAGTFVAAASVVAPGASPARHSPPQAPASPAVPRMLQIAVPGQDVFPYKTWSRIMGRAARAVARLPLGRPDPCGDIVLRAEIAHTLCLARGMACTPDQVFVTHGFVGAFDLVLKALRLEGRCAWTEEPGYTVGREMLVWAGLRPVPVRVDAGGMDVGDGIAQAPDAALAIVTPGQQAPTGVPLVLARRHALLEWAQRTGAFIVEDDYLGDLQLEGRAAPALAALDRYGRVFHIGTFSKTISPTLRMGFLVAPKEHVAALVEVARRFAAAPSPVNQLAVAQLMRDGHYMRHLRRMKRVYADRRRALAAALAALDLPYREAGLALLVELPDGLLDTEAVARAHSAGLAPAALSWWYARADVDRSHLLLGVTNVPCEMAMAVCTQLRQSWSR